MERRLDRVQVQLAAKYIIDGRHGRDISYLRTEESMRKHSIFHSAVWHNLFALASAIHIALAVLDRPRGEHHILFSRMGIAAIEILCLTIYVVDFYFVFSFLGIRNMISHNKWATTRGLLLVAMVVDLGMWLISGFSTIRFSKGARPFIFILRRTNLRTLLDACISTLPRIAELFFLLLLHITFFAFAAFLLWGEQDDPQYKTLSSAWYTMLLLHTSPPLMLNYRANSPFKSEWIFLFYAFYFLIGNLFLYKLTIAVAYRGFKSFTKDKAKNKSAAQDIAWEAAFALLSNGREYITEEDWFLVIRELRQIRRDQSRALFELIRQDQDQNEEEPYAGVKLEGFRQLCRLTKADVVSPEDHRRSLIPSRYGKLKALLKRVLGAEFSFRGQHWKYFDVTVAGLVIMSSVQLYMVHSKKTLGWFYLGAGLLACFLTEMFIKLIALGPRQYWESGYRRLDVVINIVGVVFYCTTSFERVIAKDSFIVNFTLVFRLLRMGKFLNLFEMCRKVIATLSKSYSLLSKLLFVFFSLLYAFSSVAFELYAGKLSANDPRVAGTEWATFANELSFNTFTQCFETIFHVSVLVKWPIVMDAAVAVTGPWSRVFFFLVRISVDMVYFPIFLGFIIETFVAYFDRWDAAKAARLAQKRRYTLQPNKDDNGDLTTTLLEENWNGREESTAARGSARQGSVTKRQPLALVLQETLPPLGTAANHNRFRALSDDLDVDQVDEFGMVIPGTHIVSLDAMLEPMSPRVEELDSEENQNQLDSMDNQTRRRDRHFRVHLHALKAFT